MWRWQCNLSFTLSERLVSQANYALQGLSSLLHPMGRHITGTTGSFGAAAAMAKALHLDPTAFSAALGHAASMAGGIRAMFGTDTKALHMGRGAQNGYLAARLASTGFGSCARPIESWAQLVSSTVHEDEIAAIVTTGKYQILENTFKPYPCGIVIHPLIDAGLQAHVNLLQLQHDQQSANVSLYVQAVDAIVNPQCVRLCSVRHPQTGLETIFSLYHGIAVALLHGKAGPDQFSDEGCQDKQTAQLRDKIRVHTDESIADDAAILVIKLPNDATVKEYRVEHATGSLARPMMSQQLEEKFLALSVSRLGEARAKEVIARCWKLDAETSMQEFVQMLAASEDVQ